LFDEVSKQDIQQDANALLPLFKDSQGTLNPRKIAYYFLEKHHVFTIRETGDLYVYFTESSSPEKLPPKWSVPIGYYHRKGETYFRTWFEMHLGEYAKDRLLNETLSAVKNLSYIDLQKVNGNGHQFLLPLKNCIIDVSTGEVINTPAHEFNFTFQLPVWYNPDADCPFFKQFLEDVLMYEDIPLVQEMFGYCLLRDYPIHKAFMLYGTGRNGKSTLLRILQGMLGKENVTSPSLQEILSDRFAKAELFGKLANIHADIPSTVLKNTGAFKMLTGQDLIHAQHKFRDPFSFTNTAKLIYSCNELPRTTDYTPAFFSRWIIVQFPRTFEQDDPLTDQFLADKIINSELSGVFNWALEGLQRLLLNGKFSKSKSQQEIENKWIRATDSLASFIRDRIETEAGSIITKEEFYNQYLDYCDAEGMKVEAKNSVGSRLPTLIPGVQSAKARVGGKSVRVWRGIKFKEETEEDRTISETHKLPAWTIENTGKNCGICGKPIEGESVRGPAGLGDVHPECLEKWKMDKAEELWKKYGGEKNQ